MSILDLPAVLQSLHLPEPPFPAALGVSVGSLVVAEFLDVKLATALFSLAASLTCLASSIKSASSRLDLLNLSAFLSEENRFTALLLLGQVLSVVGDVLLLAPASKPSSKSSKSKKKKAARANASASTRVFSGSVRFGNIASFLSYVIYTLAFASQVSFKTKGDFRWPDFGMTIIFAVLFTDWLGLLEKERQYNSWFEVPQELRGPIALHITILSTMVAIATATDKGFQHIMAAWGFTLADLFAVSSTFGVDDPETEAARAGSTKSQWRAKATGSMSYHGAQLLISGCI